MRSLLVAGPPSSGKTAVIMHAAGRFMAEGETVAAVKFDTRSSLDPETCAAKLGIPAIGGISGYLCPDHYFIYFISNMEEAMAWGKDQSADCLFVETAGLCLRCAPHIRGVLNPIDINKRIASGELRAALIISAFARTFREGTGRMVWPKSGALAVPLMACLAAGAAPVAHDVLDSLLSDEFQRVVARDGMIAPARPGVPGFEELEDSGWNCFWPGWDCIRSVAEAMCSADINPS